MRPPATATVITFPTDRPRAAAAREPGATGEIVIFTGVRIERMEEPAEPPRARRRGGPGRARAGETDFY